MEWHKQGKTEVLGETNVLVTLCPQQISHGLTWDRGRRMTWSIYAWNFSSYLIENSPRAVEKPAFIDM